MALELHSYDFTCFAIVAIAIAGSLWVILKKEGSRRPDDWTMYDYWSLLIVANAQAGEPELVALARAGHVGEGQLWTSCWRCLHPGWLLALRILAFVALVGSLSCDIWTYDSSIMLYYTEVSSQNVGRAGRSRLLDPLAGVRLRPDHRRSGGRGGGRALAIEGRAAEDVGSLDSLLEKASPSLASRVPSSRMAFLLSQMVLLDGAYALYFYTQWTFTLVIIYFAIGTVISAHGCWMHSKLHATEDEDEEANGFIKREFVENNHATLTFRRNNLKEMNEKRAGLWGYAMQIIYQTSAGAAMMTDVVFWGLLVPFMSEKFTVNGIMFCMHSLNAIFLLIDTILNSLPFPLFRMAYFVFWSCTYVIFQWVLHACGFTWWPYPFFELSTPWAPLWYFAMAVVHVPCYIFFWLVVKAKNSFFPKWFPHAYIRSH